MANTLSNLINNSTPITEKSIDIVESDNNVIVEQSEQHLDNLSVDDILEKCESETVITPDSIPYENVRNNSKIFLIYFAKSQLGRVIKLSGYLEQLEDQLMMEAPLVNDPDVLIRMINTIQNSMMTAINLIDRVSTDDSYVKLVFNDNRQIINNLNQTITSNVGINLSKESRAKLRGLADSLLTEVDSAIKNGGEFSENRSESTSEES